MAYTTRPDDREVTAAIGALLRAGMVEHARVVARLRAVEYRQAKTNHGYLCQIVEGISAEVPLTEQDAEDLDAYFKKRLKEGEQL